MRLSDLLDELQQDGEQLGDYRVAALVRDREVPIDDAHPFDEQPVSTVHVDEDDGEINLILASPGESGLSVEALAERLGALPAEHGDRPLFTGTIEEVPDEDYDLRHDVPVVGIAIDDTGKTFGLLQWYEGIDEELGPDTE